jgi:integron integrase
MFGQARALDDLVAQPVPSHDSGEAAGLAERRLAVLRRAALDLEAHVSVSFNGCVSSAPPFPRVPRAGCCCVHGDDDAIVVVMESSEPRLLDRVRQAIRVRHYSRRTEEAYVLWIRRFILFNGKRHPSVLGSPDIAAFLSALATRWRVSASTQNQALSAVLFLYREVLHLDVGPVAHVPRAITPERVPVVLTVEEVRRVLAEVPGVSRLIAGLLYGAGLRLQESLDLRVKDIDFARCEIVVRRGKGQKDRRTMLPVSMKSALEAHLERVRDLHIRDLGCGLGRVALPDALDRKYPQAAAEWRWQFVFPAARICRDSRWGAPSRFHLHESVPMFSP